MKRDEIATGEAVPNDPDYRTSLAVDLAVALAGFVNACADIPPRGGGSTHQCLRDGYHGKDTLSSGSQRLLRCAWG